MSLMNIELCLSRLIFTDYQASTSIELLVGEEGIGFHCLYGGVIIILCCRLVVR